MSNQSGIKPVEFKVLVLPDEVDEKTAGGIYLPAQVKEKDQWAQTKGLLVAVGGNAFTDWEGLVPSAGDRVVFSKYAGKTIEGADGKRYTLCQDKDIAGVLDS